MTPSELKANIEATGRESYFFTRKTMKFFGDTMKNYGVRAATVTDLYGEQREVWELYRKKPVKEGNRDSAYFDRETYRQVHVLKGANQ